MRHCHLLSSAGTLRGSFFDLHGPPACMAISSGAPAHIRGGTDGRIRRLPSRFDGRCTAYHSHAGVGARDWMRLLMFAPKFRPMAMIPRGGHRLRP